VQYFPHAGSNYFHHSGPPKNFLNEQFVPLEDSITVTVEISGQLVTLEGNEANTLMQRLVGEVCQRIWMPAVGLFRSSFGRWNGI